MKHESYERIVPGSDTAVLFLHGILGTPRHFEDLISLVPDSWSFSAPLLPGHGGSVRDFSKSSMDEWKKTAEESLLRLAKDHRRVFVAAHSMGTLFAIRLAAEKAEIIKGLFLLAVPLRLSLKMGMVENMLKLYSGRIAENDLPAVAARKACSVTLSKNVLAYLGWIPRYLELFSEIRAVRKLVGRMSVPAKVFQSAKDELVSRKAADCLAETGAECRELSCSRHYYYAPDDYKTLLEEFGIFINERL